MQPDPQPTLDLEAIRERFVTTENIDDGTKAYVDALFWSARDVPALLAALEEARRERDETRLEILNRNAAVNVLSDELELMTQERDEALSAQIVVQCDDPEHADRERMRPVVEAAQAMAYAVTERETDTAHRRLLSVWTAYDEADPAAVDTYESQEDTDGEG